MSIQMQYPILIALRNAPVGIVEGIGMSGRVMYHDTQDSRVFNIFEEFVAHVASKQPQTRNVQEYVRKELSVIVRMGVMCAVPIIDVQGRWRFTRDCVHLAEVEELGSFNLYTGDLKPPEPSPRRIVMLPEPFYTFPRTTIEFDSDDDTVVLSDSEEDETMEIQPFAEDAANNECSICCEALSPGDRRVASCNLQSHSLCSECVVRHATNWQNHSISALNPDAVLCPHEGCRGQFEFDMLRGMLREGDMQKLEELRSRFSCSGVVHCPSQICCMPRIAFQRLSPNAFLWTLTFAFDLGEVPAIKVRCADSSIRPRQVKRLPLEDPRKAVYRVEFDVEDPEHCVRVQKEVMHVHMDLLRDASEGSVRVPCSRCGLNFCYHCLRQYPSNGHCDCADEAVPMTGNINRWFVRPASHRHEGQLMEVLMRNYELTCDICIAQLESMCSGETLSVPCACCGTQMHKSSACNELTHCGIRRCYVCGISGLEGEKNLLDHYGHGYGCPLYDNSPQWIEATHGVPRCVEGQCYDDSHDCCRPEHGAYRSMIVHARRKRMLSAALKTLPPDLMNQVVRKIIARGGALRALFEDNLQCQVYFGECC